MFPRLLSASRLLFVCGLILLPAMLHAQDVWSAPAFSADAEALRRAAAEIKPAKDVEATILLNDFNLSVDASGKIVKHHHMIYRIETKQGVEDWSEVEGNWDPWYQAKPEIKARVITADGAVHALDLKTLNDVPTHENSPDVYTDERSYGGPLPALAIDSIVEEEVITRDTSTYFSGGIVEGYFLAHDVPVNKTRFVLSYPESLPLRYAVHLLPNATEKKEHVNGVETVIVESGPMDAVTSRPGNVPPDVLLEPDIDFWTGASWQQVAAEYARQVAGKLRLPDVQAIVARLDLAKASNPTMIEKLVEALHRSVRYTGVEFGESSLIPQFPAETLKRKYGDCKDKATLLVAMLQSAGIPAQLALLNSGPGEDVDPGQPGMGAFDHAIVHVPATDANPELWIDATDEYSRVGELPEMDYGRWALIADEKTTALTRTPELTAEKNVHTEWREFTLASYGPAQILEKNEQSGPVEEDYRDFYAGDAKKIREGSEKYVKDEYLADSLGSFEKSDPGNLEKPFVVSFAAKGRRGFTEMDNASVYILKNSIFDGLPKYFYATEKQEKGDEAENKPKPRTVDWVITPFITEWHYKITAPPGFKIRALPINKDEQMGTARFSQSYSSSQDGTVVEAVLRFDTGKARLTVDEGKALRDAVVKAEDGEGISISFDEIGQALMSAGKVKDALAADRQIVAARPKDALAQVRLARVLLGAGLGEEARAVVKQAIALDPSSAQVYSEQAWILEHDLIGRRFGKGFDYSGAVAAYRKAKQLDPKDAAIRANLAILLEYGDDGQRYSKKAHLEDAIAEFQELKKLDADYARSYDDFIPYDYWYLGKFKEMSAYLASLPASDIRKALTLACVAADESPDAAIKKSLEITANEEERSKALTTAGRMLIWIRKYVEAGGLLEMGSRGQSDENQMAAFVERLKTTKRFETVTIDASKPTSVVKKMLNLVLSDDFSISNVVSLMSKVVRDSPSFMVKNGTAQAEQITFELRVQAEKTGIPLEAMADLVLSHALFSTQGDDSLGYRVTIETPGAEARDAYIVKEDGEFRFIDFQNGGSPEAVAWEVLARLRSHDLLGARKWLDWAREEVHLSGGDDPLAGPLFPRFWTKGQEADESAIRTAALALMSEEDLQDEHVSALVDAKNHAESDSKRTNLNLVLARAYAAHEKWAELRLVAGELMQAAPDSIIAFQFAAQADAGLRQFDDWDKLLQARLQKHPDELGYIRSAAELARYRGDFAKARELTKGIIDRGKADTNTLNRYAWDALFVPGGVDADAISAAERGTELSRNSSFGVMHTLACLYAQAGRPTEARKVLLKAMDAGNLPEPNAEVWFAFAQIAASYGENDAARAMYARVEKPKTYNPAETYNLAQQKLAALQNAKTSAHVAGR